MVANCPDLPLKTPHVQQQILPTSRQKQPVLLPLAQLENVTTSHSEKSSDFTTNMAENCPDDSLTIPRLALHIVLTSRHEYLALLFLT